MLHISCNMLHISCNMLHISCNMLHSIHRATCNGMRCAPCNRQLTPCDMRSLHHPQCDDLGTCGAAASPVATVARDHPRRPHVCTPQTCTFRQGRILRARLPVCAAWCMVHVAWCMVYASRCTLHAARCMLHVACCTSHAARCMQHVSCCTTHVARCMPQAAFCMSHVACCTLYVA